MSSISKLAFYASLGLALTAATTYASSILTEKAVQPINPSALLSCPPIANLNSLLAAHEAASPSSPYLQSAFAYLFPFADPAYNALMATFYISSFPNLILAFIPASIEVTSLNTMIAFATGGLLGDTFLNLIPHSFMGEPLPGSGINVMVVEPKRNIIISLALFGGFASFFLLDKTMRYLSALNEASGGETAGAHSHSHSHGVSTAVSSSEKETDGLRMRSGGKAVDSVVADDSSTKGEAVEVNPSLQLGAYLNLFADFTHNITDGLAMSAAFYASPAIGATTTLACFAHEIPHEIADYSVLIKSGFSKKKAMGSQFLTAVGAFVGTLLGIFIQKMAADDLSTLAEEPDLVANMLNNGPGIMGTSATGADLVIPMVAGSFLYIASVSVVPELLAESRSGKQLLKEALAMLFGISCMAVLAWQE